ncbi:Shq1 protein domain [Trypanosoma melophagium]|uniref:Shq1 protein domain n=1 Tax=Trypanosoma melophagium TaxID=715481 RepID=UPI00351A427B|nr:Shq1 protein domain [Trypanosoma melophagium]
MLTPLFVCTQDDSFVIVSITLSALCKVTKAVFSILRHQFTFHCAPYYLRLKFDQPIAEGCGERATFAVETNVLTVYVPKESPGEVFTQLDNPAYLIATEKERLQLVQLVGGIESNTEATNTALLEEDEMEFRQQLPSGPLGAETGFGDYGFAGNFTGLFASRDPDVVADVLDLPLNPDETTAAQRRQLRLEEENNAFNEDALLVSFEDEDGEVRRLLHYVPEHRLEYVTALEREGIRYVAPSAAAVEETAIPTSNNVEDDVREDEDAVLPLSTGVVDVWAGNIAEFKKPLIEEVSQSETTIHMGNNEEISMVGTVPPKGGLLAVPQQRPCALFTPEEHQVMIHITAPRLLFPPTASVVNALTADILFAEAYDDIVTEGNGCSESLWNICKLSPALSWLDPADNLYDACIFFARRALIYPLHREFSLVQRVFSSVGIRMLMGKSYVLKALLRVREIFAHAEHRHVLVILFLNPLIGYWLNVQSPDEQLVQLALELHAHTIRATPEEVAVNTSSSLLVRDKKTLLPLHLLNLGLPIS